MFKKIFNLLSLKDKIKFLLLIIIYFPVSVLETISLGSIPIYLLFITDKSKILNYIDNLFIENYINSLKNSEIALIGFVPDPQRYFDFHHTEDDVFENVHKRELELGCASIASLIYLIDKYGLGEETP